MVRSQTQNENYISYLMMELIMAAVLTFIGAGLIIFYVAGKSETRSDSGILKYLFDNPFYLILLCLVPVIIAIGTLLYFRNRNYIIGYKFDYDNGKLAIEYRGLGKKIYSEEIDFENLLVSKFHELKILMNQRYRGVRIKQVDKPLKLDFVSNNFIWEKQIRKKIEFLRELEQLEKGTHNIS